MEAPDLRPRRVQEHHRCSPPFPSGLAVAAGRREASDHHLAARIEEAPEQVLVAAVAAGAKEASDQHMAARTEEAPEQTLVAAMAAGAREASDQHLAAAMEEAPDQTLALGTKEAVEGS